MRTALSARFGAPLSRLFISRPVLPLLARSISLPCFQSPVSSHGLRLLPLYRECFFRGFEPVFLCQGQSLRSHLGASHLAANRGRPRDRRRANLLVDDQPIP